MREKVASAHAPTKTKMQCAVQLHANSEKRQRQRRQRKTSTPINSARKMVALHIVTHSLNVDCRGNQCKGGVRDDKKKYTKFMQIDIDVDIRGWQTVKAPLH